MTVRREVLPPIHRGRNTRIKVIVVVTMCAGAIAGIAPRTIRPCVDGSEDRSTLVVLKLVYEAYPSWAATHPDQHCPRDLRALREYMNGSSDDTFPFDGWGHPIVFECGERGVPVARSAGEDGIFNTEDDIYREGRAP